MNNLTAHSVGLGEVLGGLAISDDARCDASSEWS
jgi:hypothetical protein